MPLKEAAAVSRINRGAVPPGPPHEFGGITVPSGLRRTVEQAFRLPCRYAYRHSPNNVGTDADVAT